MKKRSKINCYRLFKLLSDYYEAKFHIIFDSSCARIFTHPEHINTFLFYLSYRKIQFDVIDTHILVYLNSINQTYPSIMRFA